MRQGSIWFDNLNPAEGSEQAGRRPVVIISGDTLNDTLPIVIVCPVTSSIKSYPTCVALSANRVNGLKNDSEVITFQIRAIAKRRLYKRMGRISPEQLREIMKGLFALLTH